MAENIKQFIDLLIKAKQSTYANSNSAVMTLAPLTGAKLHEYEQGALFYRDIYYGFLQFTGQEVIYQRETAVWSMSYSGKCFLDKDSESIYGFLRQALLQSTRDMPFRGPFEFNSENDLRYVNCYSGNFDFFSGEEQIWHNNMLAYKLYYSGGWVN
ncbi:DUF5680 domain-containing protein [Escherichia albertii]|nr:DUF5680 domain-containing protein [Escherichia albertii]